MLFRGQLRANPLEIPLQPVRNQNYHPIFPPDLGNPDEMPIRERKTPQIDEKQEKSGKSGRIPFRSVQGFFTYDEI